MTFTVVCTPKAERILARLLLTLLCGAATCCLAGPTSRALPQPQYHPLAGDPAWLSAAVQFHGHLGPWATIALRLGMAGREKVGAKGYFDLEVTCEGPFAKPPKSCFLDGLQVATGATLGKRNLHWVQAEQVVVRVKNVRTGRTAEVRPTAKLLALLASVQLRPLAGSGPPVDDHGPQAAGRHKEEPAEALARRIAAMPDQEVFTVKCADLPPAH